MFGFLMTVHFGRSRICWKPTARAKIPNELPRVRSVCSISTSASERSWGLAWSCVLQRSLVRIMVLPGTPEHQAELCRRLWCPGIIGNICCWILYLWFTKGIVMQLHVEYRTRLHGGSLGWEIYMTSGQHYNAVVYVTCIMYYGIFTSFWNTYLMLSLFFFEKNEEWSLEGQQLQ